MRIENELKKIEWMRITYWAFILGGLIALAMAMVLNLSWFVGIVFLVGGAGMYSIHGYTKSKIQKERKSQVNPEFDEPRYLEKLSKKLEKKEDADRLRLYQNPAVHYVKLATEPTLKTCQRCGHRGKPMEFKVGKAVKKYYEFNEGGSVWECPKCGAVWSE